MSNTFEITLAAARVNVDLTQQEVVEILKENYEINITRQKLSDYEKDSTNLPISLAKALTSIYRISEENIFFGAKSTLSYTLELGKSNVTKQPA
ncbi:helix-turn-helix transcriptional regulator [Enterococcus hirae]|uniref:helix-turn-helix transcriptional regulator n=1 Tax=Enterococcus hirae TaxID=1354 RepID=UPI001D661CE8|nr:helix-turn-helix transcriptional regulator [Enterococcus hirae]